ncbi:MAG: class I SAM-dependent methyltransferase [Nitrososphaerales archaeon]
MNSYIYTRLLYIINHLMNSVAPDGQKKCLNIGSGPGWLERILIHNPNLTLFSLDISYNMASMSNEFSESVVADAEVLPFNNDSFDIIVTMRAIKFLDVHKLLIEIKNVLRSPGFLFIIFDCGDVLWARFLEKLGILVDVGINRKTLTTKNLLSELKSFGFKFYAYYPITALPLSLFKYVPKAFWPFLRLIDLPKLWGARLNMILCMQ